LVNFKAILGNYELDLFISEFLDLFTSEFQSELDLFTSEFLVCLLWVPISSWICLPVSFWFVYSGFQSLVGFVYLWVLEWAKLIATVLL
jgi:hypothetical protein